MAAPINVLLAIEHQLFRHVRNASVHKHLVQLIIMQYYRLPHSTVAVIEAVWQLHLVQEPYLGQVITKVLEPLSTCGSVSSQLR